MENTQFKVEVLFGHFSGKETSSRKQIVKLNKLLYIPETIGELFSISYVVLY